jgi:DDE family transposase
VVRAPAGRLHLWPGRQQGAVAPGQPACRRRCPRSPRGRRGESPPLGDFRYAAKSWTVERRVIPRVEAGPQGADSRFIVTNLPGLPKTLYEKVYCARGQAENLIKAHKLHLASDRTSRRKATANQFRLLIHTAASWLLLTLRTLAPRTSFWRQPQFDTIRLCLSKVAGRITEMVTRIKVAPPSAFPYQAGFATLAGRIAKPPP